jgi:adenylate kinase
VSAGNPMRASIVTATEGVLVTGVYGTGKTSVCEELAELLESAGAAYGAIDLDWLTWFGIAGLDAVQSTCWRRHRPRLSSL